MTSLESRYPQPTGLDPLPPATAFAESSFEMFAFEMFAFEVFAFEVSPFRVPPFAARAFGVSPLAGAFGRHREGLTGRHREGLTGRLGGPLAAVGASSRRRVC